MTATIKPEEEYYLFLRDSAIRHEQAANDYGKWLITTLNVLHAGGIYLIGSSERSGPLVGSWVMPILIAGLIFSLYSGFATWRNWSFLMKSRASEARWVLANGWKAPDRHPFEDEIGRSFRAAVATGWLSVVCLALRPSSATSNCRSRKVASRATACTSSFPFDVRRFGCSHRSPAPPPPG